MKTARVQRETTMTKTHAGSAPARTEPLTKMAVVLAAATLIQLVVMEAAGVHGPIWITQGVLAAATVAAAWRAGGTTLRNPLAFGALILGAVLFVAFVGFTIVEA
jgi:xanthine/uracil permease